MFLIIHDYNLLAIVKDSSIIEMSIKERLNLTAVEVIKATRGTAKGKVSRYVKALDSVLFRDLEAFLLEDIDHNRADMVYNQLDVSIEECQELYNRCHQYAELHNEVQVQVKPSILRRLKKLTLLLLNCTFLIGRHLNCC